MMSLTGNADARAVNLGQAVDIEDFDAQLVRDAVTHLLAPALGADDALLQVELVTQAALGDFLGEQKRVARRAGDDRGMQVLHHLKLLLSVAGTHRDRHGAQALAAKLEADACGPQAVTWGNLDTVEIGDARSSVAALKLDCPIGHVLGGVGDDDRRARRARRAVDTHDFLIGNRLQPERIYAAKVVLFREGKLLEVLLRAHVSMIDVLEFLGVERRTILDGGKLRGNQLELLVGHLHDGPLLMTWSHCGATEMHCGAACAAKLRGASRSLRK